VTQSRRLIESGAGADVVATRKRSTKQPGSTARRRGAEELRLTHTVSSGGCAAKIGPGELGRLLRAIPQAANARLLVGKETRDDAAVYRLRPDLALVTTVDFFPPMVDDPYTFGRIAAANALSDVYAMGGSPAVALNIVAFPTARIPLDVLGRILAGGAERVAAAGAVVGGGHSICDDEIKYGLAVTGTVHPRRIVRNGGAKAGDLLVLTKPLGTGIVATGIKRGAAEPVEEEAAIRSMVALNDVAGAELRAYSARACTDITGFGLAGHAAEMAEASRAVRLVFDADALQLLPGTARLAEGGFTTGGAGRNLRHLGGSLSLARDLAPAVAAAVVDPQTSGGLLVSLPARHAPGYVRRLHAKGVRPAIIGRVEKRPARSRVAVVIE
jgi:selenide,water dikinase